MLWRLYTCRLYFRHAPVDRDALQRWNREQFDAGAHKDTGALSCALHTDWNRTGGLKLLPNLGGTFDEHLSLAVV